VEFPDELEVDIEVPRGGFIKRTDSGSIDFVSPAPCPFNYGSVPGSRSGDGDRLDAVVMGPRLARGTRVRMPVVGCVDFVDAGREDPKFVCSEAPLGRRERLLLAGFFGFYARAKRVLNFARGARGLTRYGGFVERR
jgi:inorganic pyrophosphatase